MDWQGMDRSHARQVKSDIDFNENNNSKKMKVYIVTKGVYSDYQIVKVFSDYATAERYKDLNSKESLYDYWDVEEHDIHNENYNT